MIKIFNTFVIISTIVLLSSCTTKTTNIEFNPDNYKIYFGIYEPGTYSLKELTNTIPLKLKESGFSYGYAIKSKDKSNFQEYAIAYPPAEGVVGDEVIKTEKNGIKGPVGKSKYGQIWHKYGFDKGDPDGKWVLDIYVNDNLVETIEYEVVKR